MGSPVEFRRAPGQGLFTRYRLQTDTDLLRVITGALLTSFPGVPMTLNPKNWGFSEFLATSGCGAHLSEFSPKLLEVDQDNLRMKLK